MLSLRRSTCKPLALIISLAIIFIVRNNQDPNQNAKQPDEHEEFLSAFREELRKRREMLQYANRTLITLPSYCSSSSSSWPYPTYKEIIIKGERHSGTNWVRSILEKNVKKSVVVDQNSLDIGWKHGFLPPDGWGRPIEQDDLLIVVTRDVFTWLPKMYQETYDPEMREKGKRNTFHDFIRLEYTARCQPKLDNVKKHLSEYQIEFCKRFYVEGLFKSKYDPIEVVAEKADNLVQIRTAKYKQWLSDNPGVEAYTGDKDNYLKRRMHLRLEDLTNTTDGTDAKTRQENAFVKPLTNRCVPLYDEFLETIERTKWKGFMMDKWKGKEYDAAHERELLLKRYTKEDLRFVLSQLDLEFEKKIGYDYSYIYELLNRDDIPEKFQPNRFRHEHKWKAKAKKKKLELKADAKKKLENLLLHEDRGLP